MSAALPYRDPSRSVEERVDDLLGRMTLPEKVGQMLQLDAQEDLADVIDHRMAGSILHTPPGRLLEAHERAARTRLGIPLLVADDCIHGHSFWPGATILPSQLAQACSWDPALVARGARMTAEEVAPTGIHWTFSPVLCIARDLRWGRVDETFGEDPHLLGELGVAMVEGYQGSGLADPTGILACAKHFAGYSETIGGRDASEADISRRKLRSWFLPPFERVARAGARSFMLGYESIDGVPITVNDWLLNDVLRDEWGFTGTLVTDWNNVGSLVDVQRVAADIAEAAAMAIQCSNDFVMTTPSFFEGAQEAVRRGLVTESQVDEQVRRILTLKVQMGLFEDPRLPDVERQRVEIGTEAHRAVALEQAVRGLVLLTNDGTLPVAAGTRRIAVLGPNADDVQSQLGDWAAASGQVEWMLGYDASPLTVTALDGIRSRAPLDCEVVHTRGAGIGSAGIMTVDELGQPHWPVFQPEPVDEQELAAAVGLAQDSDLAVVVVGDCVPLNGEGKSTATLELQGGQVELLERVIGTGTPTVVVVVSGKPLVLPECVDRAAALVQQFNPGMLGGEALARILWGDENPSGRLPITIARHVGQQPVFYNQVRGQHGERYADLTQQPHFVFGQGLGYTSFEYSDLELAERRLGVDDVVRARVTVTNTGRRAGRETVQTYLHDEVTSVTWAGKELKAFAQVDLDPGESRQVDLRIPVQECSLVDRQGVRRVEAGSFQLLVGHSSLESDLVSATFEVI